MINRKTTMETMLRLQTFTS